MRLVTRLAAAALVLVQLQWLPATVLCERRHETAPAHCDQSAPAAPAPAGPAVAAPDVALTAGCPLMPGCAALTSAARLAEPVRITLPRAGGALAAATVEPPHSRALAPTPPPPEV
jgi:hypothetical protein